MRKIIKLFNFIVIIIIIWIFNNIKLFNWVFPKVFSFRTFVQFHQAPVHMSEAISLHKFTQRFNLNLTEQSARSTSLSPERWLDVNSLKISSILRDLLEAVEIMFQHEPVGCWIEVRRFSWSAILLFYLDTPYWVLGGVGIVIIIIIIIIMNILSSFPIVKLSFSAVLPVHYTAIGRPTTSFSSRSTESIDLIEGHQRETV